MPAAARATRLERAVLLLDEPGPAGAELRQRGGLELLFEGVDGAKGGAQRLRQRRGGRAAAAGTHALRAGGAALSAALAQRGVQLQMRLCGLAVRHVALLEFYRFPDDAIELRPAEAAAAAKAAARTAATST